MVRLVPKHSRGLPEYLSCKYTSRSECLKLPTESERDAPSQQIEVHIERIFPNSIKDSVNTSVDTLTSSQFVNF